MTLQSEPYPKRRLDALSGVLLLVTLAALVGTAWVRFFGTSNRPSAVVGGEAPPLRLIDAETGEPIVLVGLNDKVAWLVFWSAASPTGRPCLSALEAATRGLMAHPRFAMVSAAIETGDPAKVRATAREAGFHPRVYLADDETCRRFQVGNADPPLHILIDAGSRIMAMARGDGQPMMARFAELARERLEEIDPRGEDRFAAAPIHQRR